MNELEILFKHIPQDRIREILEETLRQSLSSLTPNDIERIVSNQVYRMVGTLVDEMMDQNLQQNIRDKTREVIQSLTTFTVFREACRISRSDDSVGKKILDEAVVANKSLINKRVVEIIEQMDPYDLGGAVQKAIVESIKS